ncbi:MAG TPA: NAD(P)-binding domain-containing protein [Chitinivibrionales bacterium]|nr:NAD(P)-binding domain-containing protein [Chitinivibrionales bacterium]
MKFPFLYFGWLQKDNPSGTVERLPELTDRFETSVPGLYCIGDLTGVPLIKLAAESGSRLMKQLSADETFAAERNRKAGDVYDLIIIGAGPSGVSASIRALELGYKHLIVESSRAFNTIGNFPAGKPIYVTPAGPVQSPLTFTDGSKETLIAQLRAGMAVKNIPLHEGEMVKNITGSSGRFSVETAAATYKALRVVIAIGKTGATRSLGVPGERLPKVFSRLIDPGLHHGQDILVVGGGDSAVEAAVALAKSGNRVTLSYRKASLGRPKERTLRSFNDLAQAGVVTPLFESKVKEIRETDVLLSTRRGDTAIPNAVVFVLIGSAPPVGFFKKAGVRLQGEFGFPDKVALAAFLFFAMMLYFGKKAPVAAISGLGDFVRLPLMLGGFAWPQQVDGLAAWFGFVCFAIIGLLLAAYSAKKIKQNALSVWNGFKFGYYLAISVFVCYLYIAYKLLAQRPLLFDMGDWYTALYSLTIVIFGLRRMYVRSTGYITRQTLTLMAFQVLPLFVVPLFVLPYMGSHHLLPAWIMEAVFPNQSYWRAFGFILAWPLFIYNAATGTPTMFWLVLGILQTFVVVPFIVYKWGKGAYCGWVCPCGAMAESLGDEHRTHALHGPTAKKAENLGQAVLWLAVLVTIASLAAGTGSRGSNSVLEAYSLIVDIVLAGVIGLGAYFHFSGRVWCRFFCPLAALMHIYGRFSPYRIMANKKRCISCNICTKVCHMGIDVMNFANKGVPMNDVQCVRCSACIVNCPLQVLTFGSVGSADLENDRYRKARVPLSRGWQSGLLKKDIDMLLAEEETQSASANSNPP